MIPVAAVIAAIALAAPGVPRADRARYAADIAAASPNLSVAHALVATAAVESDFRPAIEQCNCREDECDRDVDGHAQAVGLFQLHWYHFAGHTAEEVCASNHLAAQLTARALSGLAARVGGMVEALRVYIGTSVKPDDPRFKRRLNIYLALEGEPTS